MLEVVQFNLSSDDWRNDLSNSWKFHGTWWYWYIFLYVQVCVCVCVCVCVFVFYFTTQSIKTTTVPQHFPQDQMGML